MLQKLLSTSERIFRTDIRYVGKNGFWVSVSQGAAAVSGLLISIAFANWLPMHEYGVYKFVLAVGGLLAALKLTGLNQAVTQAVARGFDKTIFSAIKLSLRWSRVMILVSALIAIYYYWQGNEVLAIGILLTTCGSAILGSVGLYGAYLNGKQNFKINAIDSALLVLGNAFALFIALQLTDNVLYIIAVNSLSSVAIILLLSVRILRNVDKTTDTSTKSLSFGKHLSFQNAFMVSAMHIDKIILFQWIGSVELARYAFALLLPSQISTIAKSFINLIIPKYAQKTDVELRRSVKIRSLQLTSLMAIPVTLYVAAAPFLFSMLFPVYIDSVVYSQFFAVSLLSIPVSHLLLTYFNVRQATTTLLYIKIFGAAGKIGFVLVGTFFFGFIGAVGAQIATQQLMFVLFVYHYLRLPKTTKGVG